MEQEEMHIGRPDLESEKDRKIHSLQDQIDSGNLKDAALLAAQRELMELRGEAPDQDMEI